MDEILSSLATNEVRIYTKDDCTNCESTKSLMDELEINYTVINMDREPSAKAVVKSMGFRQAPVVITNTNKWSGFKESNIRGLKPLSASADDDIWN